MPREPAPAAGLSTEAGASVPEAGAKAKKSVKRVPRRTAVATEEAEAAPADEPAKAPKKLKKLKKKAAAQAEVEEPEEEAPAAPVKKRKKAAVDEEAKAEPVPTKKKRKAENGSAVSVAAERKGAKAFRKEHQIVIINGAECPDPMETFDDAAPELGQRLTKALRDCGYQTPTPIQAQAWPIALRGLDMIGVAKTGSGKTCGFLMPALARLALRGPPTTSRKFGEPSKPSALVIAPTRELAQQIAKEAEKFAPKVGARVVAVYGGVPKGPQIMDLRKGADVIIGTPGRLLDFAAGDEQRRLPPMVSMEAVNYLVLDEADRMLDMGFEPDIRKIVAECLETGNPKDAGGAKGRGTARQTLYFTATWPKDVQAAARKLTSRDAVQVRIGQAEDGDKLTANSSVKQVVKVMEEGDKMGELKKIIQNELHPGETMMVFAGQKYRCDEIEEHIVGLRQGVWCRAIHSSKPQTVRDDTLQKFRKLTERAKESERGILVATDVASRGLDIPGVAIVVIFDFGRALHSANNGGIESYVHRVGRTGRAGSTGRAFTFFTEEDLGGIELIELLKRGKQEVPKALVDLASSEKYTRWMKDQKKGRFSKGGGKGKGSGKGGKGSKGFGKGGGRWF